MSRDRRRWEDPATSHRPGFSRAYRDESSRRLYGRPSEFGPVRTFNYWREEPMGSVSYPPQRAFGRGGDSYNEWERQGDRLWHVDSSSSRQRHDSGLVHHRGDRDFRRGRSVPHQSSSRQRYSAYTTPPRSPRPTLRDKDSPEPGPSLLQSIPPDTVRKAPSPSKKTSQPPRPSSRYLSLSQQPSEVLRDHRESRKLLVLDLNGTLLIRSPRSRSSSRTRLRSVQPRPYMLPFRQYLFCPETKAWLDTMVWSSAQPHSVDDMVNKVFDVTKKELKAVWNRKSLGLSEAEYHQKTVTTKDLKKPWTLLTEDPSTASSQPPMTHSALTTVLLDDSPHKAALQPYNHVCIPEYDSSRRQLDLRSLQAAGPKKDKKEKRKSEAAHPTDPMVPALSPTATQLEWAGTEPYDPTLLAVIGILETVKLQNNIAGWIRRGGLCSTQARSGEAALGADQQSAMAEDVSGTSKQDYQQAKMWFEDPSLVAHWVAQGRTALTELGIQVVHGVTP